MKQVQRFVTLALALLLIGVPAVTMAQTSSSPAKAGAQDKATSSDKATDKAPSASPSTAPSTDSGAKSGGQASPATPMTAQDCKNNGWQKFGLKSEAECAAKVKK